MSVEASAVAADFFDLEESEYEEPCFTVVLPGTAGCSTGPRALRAAQTFTGGVRGAVKDAGGVVPGVTVTLINEAQRRNA